MRYNIHINQEKAIEWGFSHSQALSFNIMVSLSSWASPKSFEGEGIYYYCSTGLLIKELPLVSKCKSTFNGIIKSFKEKGLIEWKAYNNKSYYRISNKGKEWLTRDALVARIPDTGGGKPRDNKNTSYNITIDNIYKKYITIIPKEKRKYTKSAQAKLYLEQLLKKGFTEDQLMGAIVSYNKKTTEKKYILACQYFFSNTKAGKYYRPFIDYIEEKKKNDNPIRIKGDLF